MPSLQLPCKGCGTPVDFDPEYRIGNHESGVFCWDCIERLAAERQARQNAMTRQIRWQAICPPRFRDTVIEKLPCPERSMQALRHDFTSGQGLNLWGVPSSGKSRTMYLIIHALFFKGEAVKVFTPMDFMAELESRAYHHGTWIKQIARYDVVAFDDLDKLALTAPQEKALFALLDSRMTHRRPCVFTHNSTAQKLELAFKTGPALTRRIREFTESIHFGNGI